MPPAQSQAGNRHAGIPREGWWLLWGKWSYATTPEDAPTGTFGWGQSDHSYGPQWWQGAWGELWNLFG